MDEQGLDSEPPVPYVEDEPDDEEEEPVVRQYKEPDKVPSYNFTAAAESKPDIKDLMKKVEKKKRHVFIDGEKFSLKKAVIYSEVMNRKYT